MSRRRNAAFTLVELLVVIGIIALLVSILLPALSKAKRGANTVKCAAALKQIGNSFLLYAHDNKGWWPSARDRLDPAVADQHSWTDLIAKYMTKQNMATFADVQLVRRNSVLWGCPEWTKSQDFDKNATYAAAENIYTGYGMQYYPTYYDQYPAAQRASAAALASLAHFRAAPINSRGFVKANVWQRRPSASRPLIMDSQVDIVRIADNDFDDNLTMFWPVGVQSNVVVGVTAAYHDSFDARHTKPGLPRAQVLKTPGINVLFCDMHVDLQTPRQVHEAIRKPGA